MEWFKINHRFFTTEKKPFTYLKTNIPCVQSTYLPIKIIIKNGDYHYYLIILSNRWNLLSPIEIWTSAGRCLLALVNNFIVALDRNVNINNKMIVQRAFQLFSKRALVGIRYGSSGYPGDTAGYQLVYSFPYVRVGGLVNRMKMKQSVFTGLALPLTAALDFYSIIPNITPVCLLTC